MDEEKQKKEANEVILTVPPQKARSDRSQPSCRTDLCASSCCSLRTRGMFECLEILTLMIHPHGKRDRKTLEQKRIIPILMSMMAICEGSEKRERRSSISMNTGKRKLIQHSQKTERFVHYFLFRTVSSRGSVRNLRRSSRSAGRTWARSQRAPGLPR